MGSANKSRLLGSLTLSVEHKFTLVYTGSHVSRGDSRLSDMFPPTLKDGRGISPRGNFSRLTGNATNHRLKAQVQWRFVTVTISLSNHSQLFFLHLTVID